jgi:tetratricopeptide (TPR) repeat protein
MGARRVKTRTIGMGAAGLLAAALAVAAGCETGQKVTTIHDTSVVRQAEARRLSAEAQKEQAAGHSEKAIELYKQAVGASPELGFAWNNLGLLYMEKDNYLDAVEVFQNAADVMHGPQGAKPLYNIGLAYWKRGFGAKALTFFDKALERDPRDLDALRGSVLAGKSMDSADDKALDRVRRVLLIETDPRYKRLEQSEQFRIETALTKVKESAPLAMPGGEPVGEAPAHGTVVIPPPHARPAEPELPHPPLDLPPAPVPAPTGPPGNAPGIGWG